MFRIWSGAACIVSLFGNWWYRRIVCPTVSDNHICYLESLVFSVWNKERNIQRIRCNDSYLVEKLLHSDKSLSSVLVLWQTRVEFSRTTTISQTPWATLQSFMQNSWTKITTWTDPPQRKSAQNSPCVTIFTSKFIAFLLKNEIYVLASCNQLSFYLITNKWGVF